MLVTSGFSYTGRKSSSDFRPRHPAVFALGGGSQRACVRRRFVAQHQRAGLPAVLHPFLDADEPRRNDGQPGFLLHFADDGIRTRFADFDVPAGKAEHRPRWVGAVLHEHTVRIVAQEADVHEFNGGGGVHKYLQFAYCIANRHTIWYNQ